MAKRPELAKYIGQSIPITATVTSRADGGKYGFLLVDITIPGGGYIDHAWLKLYWMDLAEVSGSEIRGNATVDEYWRAGRLDGKYCEYAELGTGFSDLDDVEVLVGETWMPIEEAATEVRKTRNKVTKRAKADGTYVWPGTWTYATGSIAVKAAKSAKVGARCAVKGRDAQNCRDVILTRQTHPGIWSYEEIAKSSTSS